MKKYNIPLTYEPKIPKVLSGECTQTIRIGRKFQVGDLISFHGWEGKPYRSKWSFRTPYYEINQIFGATIFTDGIARSISDEIGCLWGWASLDDLAELDGIEPPTGEELGRVLNQYHKIPPEGTPAQIIRWRWTE